MYFDARRQLKVMLLDLLIHRLIHWYLVNKAVCETLGRQTDTQEARAVQHRKAVGLGCQEGFQHARLRAKKRWSDFPHGSC